MSDRFRADLPSGSVVAGGPGEQIIRVHPVVWVTVSVFATAVALVNLFAERPPTRSSVFGFVLVSVAAFAVVLRTRLIVTEDRVVIVGLFRRRPVERSRIIAVRCPYRGYCWFEVEPTPEMHDDPWLGDRSTMVSLPYVFLWDFGRVARTLGVPAPDAVTREQIAREWGERSRLEKAAGAIAAAGFVAFLVANWLGLLPE